MGYYIEVPSNHGKARKIVEGEALGTGGEYKAEIISRPASFADVPSDKALICVVDNGFFEAAGYAYDESEFNAFAEPDGRSRTWVLMDKEAAERATGFVPVSSN